MNTQLHNLYADLAPLYREILPVCRRCTDHDCEGYVWVLKDEADCLCNRGIPIVEINGSINFIHSFEEVAGAIVVDKPKPPCRLRQNKLCSVYDIRPLVCRLYPITFDTLDKEIWITLHKDCLFSREIDQNSHQALIRQILQILARTPKELLIEIMDTFKQVDDISQFPDGPNSFEAIMPLKMLIERR